MTHHRRGLRRLLRDDTLAEAIERDFRSAPLDGRRHAILEYVAKLTKVPAQMVKQDADALRAAGLSDRDILEVVEVAGYYAYVNRIADGLGVLLEEEHESSEE